MHRFATSPSTRRQPLSVVTRACLAALCLVAGGASAQPGTADLANDVFGLGARIGVPGEFLGGLADSVQSPRFSTVTRTR